MKDSRRVGLFLTILLVMILACDEPDSYGSIPENDMIKLREWSGLLARYWTLPENDSLHPFRPDEQDIQSLILLCDSHPEAWAYLYNCIVDTISILEPPPATCER